ncbi:MAG TPA: hypothetical protein VKZ63_07595 [Kofleriaceae bacterium]|nr:hypothetical protein [Kofleriaceae bacterium]
MNRLAIPLVLALAGLPLAIGTACGSGPYTGKPEKLKKPRAKKRPDGSKSPTEVAEGEDGPTISEEQCRTNFFAEPHKGRRQSRDARSMAMRADSALLAAERQFGPKRQELVVEAMGTLANALDKDPYGPEPTYKLAVAYALVGKKDCSIRLLERLKALATMPEVEKEARRTIQRAARDPAFSRFEKDARTALGE